LLGNLTQLRIISLGQNVKTGKLIIVVQSLLEVVMRKYFRPLALLTLFAAVWFGGCKTENIEGTNSSQPALGEKPPQQPAPLPPVTADTASETQQLEIPAPASKEALTTKVTPATPEAPAPKTTPAPEEAKAITWRTNLEAAKREGEEKGKNLLLFFHTDWCGYCKLMLEDTFPRPEVISFVTRNLIPVKIDGDRESSLVARYGISGYPTSIVLTPQEQEKGRIPGYLPPSGYLTMLADFNRRRQER